MKATAVYPVWYTFMVVYVPYLPVCPLSVCSQSSGKAASVSPMDIGLKCWRRQTRRRLQTRNSYNPSSRRPWPSSTKPETTDMKITGNQEFPWCPLGFHRWQRRLSIQFAVPLSTTKWQLKTESFHDGNFVAAVDIAWWCNDLNCLVACTKYWEKIEQGCNFDWINTVSLSLTNLGMYDTWLFNGNGLTPKSY